MAEVVLYVIPGCQSCRQMRDYLHKRRVVFREINALESPRSLARLPSGFQPDFPIVKIGTEVIARADASAVGRVLDRL